MLVSRVRSQISTRIVEKRQQPDLVYLDDRIPSTSTTHPPPHCPVDRRNGERPGWSGHCARQKGGSHGGNLIDLSITA